MNWKWADRNKDHFVNFDHHEQRIAALEEDFHELTKDLLSYLEADMAAPWLPSAKRLSATLLKIIGRKNRKDINEQPR